MNNVLTGFVQELREKPYAGITVCDICRRAGISRNTFYRKIRSKEACLIAVIHQYLHTSCQRAEQDGLGRFFDYWQENRDFLLLLKEQGLLPVFQGQISRFVQERYSSHLDPYRVRFVIAGMLGMLLHWAENGCEASAVDWDDFLLQVLTVPFLERPTKENL